MKKIKLYLTSLFLLTTLLLPVAPSAHALPVATTQFAAKCNVKILTFPAWYNGLQCDGSGKVDPQLKKLNDVWIIALNIIQWFLVAAGYLAAGYILWSGFKYMKAQGEPGKISEAKNAITNAVIGLAIALLSVAIVQYIQGAVS